MNDLILAEKLIKLQRLKKSKQIYAKKLGITVDKVNELLLIIKNPKQTFKDLNISKKIDNQKGTLESTIIINFEPKDHLELAELHKIDLEKYNIVNYWSKLLPNGKFTSSVFSKLKTDYSQKEFIEFLQNYTSNYIPPTFSTPDTTKPLVDIELSLSDYHLAKRHIDGDNNIENRVQRYLQTVESLLRKVKASYEIRTIVFPISNDFFHTDNYQHSTTAGTPQETIVDYAQEYETGFQLLVNSIKMLVANSREVKVVLVQGNHDKTKSFYLAHGLEVYFKPESKVSFDRDTSVVKALVLGNTFLGYHHGNCKIEELPLLFATHPKYSANFGLAKYKEVHTGDKHHYMAKDVKGVRIQQMPSLSGTDRWHLENNFVHSIRAALALVYDPIVGKICEFEERI